MKSTLHKRRKQESLRTQWRFEISIKAVVETVALTPVTQGKDETTSPQRRSE